jgi:hypothetical protein
LKSIALLNLANITVQSDTTYEATSNSEKPTVYETFEEIMKDISNTILSPILESPVDETESVFTS